MTYDRKQYAREYYQKTKDKQIAAAKAWQKAHPEAKKESDKRFLEKHPDYKKVYNLKEEMKISKRNWNLKNPDYHHKYYISNKEKFIGYGTKRWNKIKAEENVRRKSLGLNLVGENFSKEMELLIYIHKVFNNYEIMTHHRKWNRWNHHGLELDIYIPKLKLAFEYQGKQHYDKIYFQNLKMFNFNNKESFEDLQYRDKCKKRICKIRGITLIKIKYDEELSEQLILSKIRYLDLNISQNKLEKF